MSLQQQFSSNANKGKLWKLLCDNGIFNNIPENKSSTIKNEFDYKINSIASQVTSSDQLINLNKRVMSEMVNDINKNHRKEVSTSSSTSSLTPPYNSADIVQKRQNAFNNELQNKQQEFDKFNNKPQPEKIDFADQMDKPIGSEMERILAEQIAIREQQLNMVFEGQTDKTVVNKWIQGPTETKINIGENIKIEEKDIITNTLQKGKKVNFNTTINDNSIDNNNDKVIEILNKILAIQLQVLELVQKRNEII